MSTAAKSVTYSNKRPIRIDVPYPRRWKASSSTESWKLKRLIVLRSDKFQIWVSHRTKQEIDSSDWKSWDCTLQVADMVMEGALYLLLCAAFYRWIFNCQYSRTLRFEKLRIRVSRAILQSIPYRPCLHVSWPDGHALLLKFPHHILNCKTNRVSAWKLFQLIRKEYK